MADPGVQSVRVAVALCDRFAELLKGPSQVTARKQEGALIGFAGDQDGLSLRIGEAQQIYPEIWRHLDDARAAFAERGVDVGNYDRVRAEAGEPVGAAVGIEHDKRGVGTHAVHTVTKSAGFNVDGLKRARAACDALVAATPDIDWAAIAKAEAHDPAAAAFTRATRTRRRIMIGLVALVVATPFIIVEYSHHRDRADIDDRAERYRERVEAASRTLDDAARSELTAEIGKRRAALATAREHWNTSTTPDGLRALVAGSAPCAAQIQGPDEAAASAYIRTGDVDPKAFDATTFASYDAARLVGALPDGELGRLDRRLGLLADRVASGQAVEADRERLPALDGRSIVVVIDKDVEPHTTQTAPLTYTPGEVTARAYVFSFADGRFVCAGAITALNTPSDHKPKFLDGVVSARGAEAVLHRELEVRLRQAIAANLYAVAP